MKIEYQIETQVKILSVEFTPRLVVVGGLAGDDETPERLMDVWCGQMK